MTNVNAHSLGIEGIEPETLRKTNVILIPRNTALPATRTERFMTKSEGQRSIVVKVLEGESTLPGECTTIGRTVVRDLPAGLPKAWPVEITFEYASNGRLSVRAMVPGTHHQAELALEREVGLSGAGIARWKTPVSAAAGFDVFEVAVHESLAGSTPAAAAGSSGILAPVCSRRPPWPCRRRSRRPCRWARSLPSVFATPAANAPSWSPAAVPAATEVPATPALLPLGGADTGLPQPRLPPAGKPRNAGHSDLSSPAVKFMGHILPPCSADVRYLLFRYFRPDLFTNSK